MFTVFRFWKFSSAIDHRVVWYRNIDIYDCETHCCVFIKIWSIKVGVLHVLSGWKNYQLLKSYVRQNSVYFLMSGENSLWIFLISSDLSKNYSVLKSKLKLSLQEYRAHPLDLVIPNLQWFVLKKSSLVRRFLYNTYSDWFCFWKH